jgi:hypothetical protein
VESTMDSSDVYTYTHMHMCAHTYKVGTT